MTNISNFMTSKQITSPPWNSRRLVHSKEMLWASCWSVPCAHSTGCFQFFPTCQVRVVRFYVSVSRVLPPPASCLLLVILLVLPLRQCGVQCGVPDLNRDPVSSVWRAGPEPGSCEFSVACRSVFGFPSWLLLLKKIFSLVMIIGEKVYRFTLDVDFLLHNSCQTKNLWPEAGVANATAACRTATAIM